MVNVKAIGKGEVPHTAYCLVNNKRKDEQTTAAVQKRPRGLT